MIEETCPLCGGALRGFALVGEGDEARRVVDCGDCGRIVFGSAAWVLAGMAEPTKLANIADLVAAYHARHPEAWFEVSPELFV